MVVTCAQMRQAEAAAFAAGVDAAQLMERAGLGCAEVVRQFFPTPGTLVLYLGTGNNAGDALVAARELARDGWRVFARLSAPVEKFKPSPLKHWQELGEAAALLKSDDVPRWLGRPLVLMDGLLGIGAEGELRPSIRALAVEMNRLRQSRHAVTIALDLPSGLNGDDGTAVDDAVIADITATIGFAKCGLVADAAINHVGRLAVVPLPELAVADPSADDLTPLTPDLVARWLPRREFDTHKGQAGRVGILAGSRGKLGAARLAAEGSLRAGAGLVTLLVRQDAYPLLAVSMPPEVMVAPVTDYRQALDGGFDVLAIGPGLGFDAEDEILDVICTANIPAVVDADALTTMAKAGFDALRTMQGPRLLTPHPGEMRRFTQHRPEWRNMPRRELAEAFAAELPGHVCLLKGARTVIAKVGEPTCFNTTGHPGMATGGMGDTLTGVCAALLGQGLPVHHAAGTGAWLCGRAAERAALEMAEEAVLPTDVAAHIGAAWRDAVWACF